MLHEFRTDHKAAGAFELGLMITAAWATASGLSGRD
jgi:hypothetical protein